MSTEAKRNNRPGGKTSISSTSISVISPVYNVEKWLKRASETLINQTFKDFEVWLINDGSTDNSGKICDQICKKDARFHTIHKKNGGAASARNAAIPKANGKYLYFMDPDDWCEPTMLEDMYNFAEKHKLELVVTGFYIDTYYSDTKHYTELRNAPDVVYKTQENFRANAHKLFDEQLLYPPWNKLYLRSHIVNNDIDFPDTFWDDLPFNLDVVRDIKRVGCIDNHYYHFLRAREEAENTKYRPNMYDKREEENTWMRDLYDYWKLNNEEIEEFLARRYSERLIGCIENITNPSCTLSDKEKKQKIKEMISTPQAIEAYDKTRPNSKMMEIMLKPLKAQNVELTIKEGQFISYVKRHSTNLFARLKSNR